MLTGFAPLEARRRVHRLPPLWAALSCDEIDAQEIRDVNDQLRPSVGTCSFMGTASTMACIARGARITCPDAISAGRHRGPEASPNGRARGPSRFAREGLTIDKVLTEAAFENAMRVLLAMAVRPTASCT